MGDCLLSQAQRYVIISEVRPWMSLNSANPTNPTNPKMSFGSLKQNKSSIFQQLQKQLEKTTQVGTVDERFWKLSTDKAGNGFAVIRFLPASDGEDMRHLDPLHACKGAEHGKKTWTLTLLKQRVIK